MKIYFDNPEYDGQFLRAIDYASLGGQIGEARRLLNTEQRSTPNVQRSTANVRDQNSEGRCIQSDSAR